TEVVVAYSSETFNLKRLTSSIIIGAIFVVIGSVTSLSFGPLKDYTLFDMTIFELMDYLASNMLLPVGGVLISVFVGWRLDRKVVASQLKVESPKQYKLLSVYIFFLRYIVPVTVGGVFASQFFS
ncbi:MAG: sodium-dependent transporter, partial [Paludibacteraceae bacterium]|nr:sodium-dependent transporter [Paludibacteraceae bacterium]